MTWRAGGRPRRRTLRTWRGGTRTWRAVARAGGRAGYAGEVSLIAPPAPKFLVMISAHGKLHGHWLEKSRQDR